MLFCSCSIVKTPQYLSLFLFCSVLLFFISRSSLQAPLPRCRAVCARRRHLSRTIGPVFSKENPHLAELGTEVHYTAGSTTLDYTPLHSILLHLHSTLHFTRSSAPLHFTRLHSPLRLHWTLLPLTPIQRNSTPLSLQFHFYSSLHATSLDSDSVSTFTRLFTSLLSTLHFTSSNLDHTTQHSSTSHTFAPPLRSATLSCTTLHSDSTFSTRDCVFSLPVHRCNSFRSIDQETVVAACNLLD